MREILKNGGQKINPKEFNNFPVTIRCMKILNINASLLIAKVLSNFININQYLIYSGMQDSLINKKKCKIIDSLLRSYAIFIKNHNLKRPSIH